MPEYIATVEPLLKVGQYVRFSEGWEEKYAEQVYVVEAAQQIPRKLWLVIQNGIYYDLDLKDVGFYPTSPKSLYEIVFKMRGENIILYPRLPSTEYFNKLEEPGFTPEPLDDNLRYIGGYTEEDFKEGRLREYTIKDMDKIVYRLYNDSPEDEHIRLEAIVNRLKIRRVSDEVARRVLEQVRYRDIPHYKAVRW